MSNYETLTVEDREGARVVAVTRPKALNALNAQVIDDLTALVEATAADGSVHGLVLTGAGEKAFVAGADIKAMQDMPPESALAFSGKGHALGEQLAAIGIPVVAAVNGFALGGGCELALACDFIYAAPTAKFGQPEVKLGVIPGFGGTQRMLRRIGLARALELCMTGEMLGADEALRLGLVNRVVTDGSVVDAAVATVHAIAKMGPLAIAKVKEVLHEGASKPLDAANVQEQEAFASLFATADQKEGMAAFLAKRAANFAGK